MPIHTTSMADIPRQNHCSAHGSWPACPTFQSHQWEGFPGVGQVSQPRAGNPLTEPRSAGSQTDAPTRTKQHVTNPYDDTTLIILIINIIKIKPDIKMKNSGHGIPLSNYIQQASCIMTILFFYSTLHTWYHCVFASNSMLFFTVLCISANCTFSIFCF